MTSSQTQTRRMVHHAPQGLRLAILFTAAVTPLAACCFTAVEEDAAAIGGSPAATTGGGAGPNCIPNAEPQLQCRSATDCCGSTVQLQCNWNMCCNSSEQPCLSNPDCCSGQICLDGLCRAVINSQTPHCSQGSDCLSNHCSGVTCVCQQEGSPCAEARECCSGVCSGSVCASNTTLGHSCHDPGDCATGEGCGNTSAPAAEVCCISASSPEECRDASQCCQDGTVSLACTGGGCCNIYNEPCAEGQDCCPGNGCDMATHLCKIATGFWGCAEPSDCLSGSCDVQTNLCNPPP